MAAAVRKFLVWLLFGAGGGEIIGAGAGGICGVVVKGYGCYGYG